MDVHSSVLDPALDPEAMHMHLGPVIMHPGMHDPDLAYGASLGVSDQSFGALGASIGVSPVPVAVTGTAGVLPTVNGSSLQPGVEVHSEYSVGELLLYFRIVTLVGQVASCHPCIVSAYSCP